MLSKRYMLIINPISGTGMVSDVERRVREALEGPEREVTVCQSTGPGDCARLAREAVRQHYYAVIAAGGDGTVNEVAGALRGTPVILGIIPRGSGNGLARHLDLSIDIDNALRIIALDNPQPCDYGTANDLPFFCTFGLGFDAAVSQAFASMKHRGLKSYIRAVFGKYIKYEPKEYSITTGGRTIKVKAFLIAVCNASQYGNNAYIAPDASLRDGLLDITIIHAGNPLTRAIVGVDMLTGYIKRNVLVQTMQVEKATICHEPGPAHLDGDPIMMPEAIQVKCHPGKLRLFINYETPEFRPLLTPLKSFHFDFRFRFNSLMTRIFTRKL